MSAGVIAYGRTRAHAEALEPPLGRPADRWADDPGGAGRHLPGTEPLVGDGPVADLALARRSARRPVDGEQESDGHPGDRRCGRGRAARMPWRSRRRRRIVATARADGDERQVEDRPSMSPTDDDEVGTPFSHRSASCSPLYMRMAAVDPRSSTTSASAERSSPRRGTAQDERGVVGHGANLSPVTTGRGRAELGVVGDTAAAHARLVVLVMNLNRPPEPICRALW
jgi:hypothetical protein